MKKHGYVLQQIDSVLIFQRESPKKYLLKENVDGFSTRLPFGNHGNYRLVQDIKENYIALDTFICLDSKFYSNESRITLYGDSLSGL